MTSITRVDSTTAVPTLRAATVAAQDDEQRRRSGGAFSIATTFGGPRKSTKGMSVKERFATLQQRFLPDKAKGVNVRFQFKLSGEGGGNWYVEIKDGKVTVKEGTGPNPTATLQAKASDYKKIADGEMNKMWAFVRGKLKVEGDKDELKKFDTYFKDSL